MTFCVDVCQTVWKESIVNTKIGLYLVFLHQLGNVIPLPTRFPGSQAQRSSTLFQASLSEFLHLKWHKPFSMKNLLGQNSSAVNSYMLCNRKPPQANRRKPPQANKQKPEKTTNENTKKFLVCWLKQRNPQKPKLKQQQQRRKEWESSIFPSAQISLSCCIICYLQSFPLRTDLGQMLIPWFSQEMSIHSCFCE